MQRAIRPVVDASGLYAYMMSLDTSSSGSERKKEARYRSDRRERSSKIWKCTWDEDENVAPADQLVGGDKLLLQ